MRVTAREALDDYLRALVDGRYEDQWQLLSTPDQVAKPLSAYLAMVLGAGGRVSPQRIESIREDGDRAEATIIVLRSLPIDPVAELRRLEAAGQGESAGAEELRRIISRWDGRCEHRPRTERLVREPDGWRVVAGYSAPPEPDRR